MRSDVAEAKIDVQAAQAKAAFFAHLGWHEPCKAAWFCRQLFPDKERLCAEGQRLYQRWWALEEA